MSVDSRRLVGLTLASLFPGLDIPEHPLFSISLTSHEAACLDAQDGFQIKLTVTNHSTTTLKIDGVTVKTAGRDGRVIPFEAESQILVPGTNQVLSLIQSDAADDCCRV